MPGPIASELRADGIRWDLAPAPWPSSAPLMAIVAKRLPTINGELVADLVEQLAVAAVERDEELKAIRSVQSAALDALHSVHQDNERLRQRLAEARSRERTMSASTDSSKWRTGPARPQRLEPNTQAQAQGQHRHLREAATPTPTQVQTPTPTPTLRTSTTPRTRTRARNT